MKESVPSSVLNGIRISVLDLQDRVIGHEQDKNKGNHKDHVDGGEKQEHCLKESKTSFFSERNISLCVAELVGTAMLMFFGCMGCITQYEAMPVPHYMPGITFGLTVMLIIQVFGHISGAHLNPAVTMVTVIYGYLEASTAVIYIIGQFAGAILGLGALKMLVPYEYINKEVFDAASNTTTMRLGFCTTAPHPKVSTMQALVLETIITAVLILVCCAIWDKRNEHKQDSAPLRFGFVVAAIAMAAGPFSGASMNTARSFAPALLNGDWAQQWIYWVGPTAGGLLAAFFYKALYSLKKEEFPSQDPLDGVPLRSIDTKDGA